VLIERILSSTLITFCIILPFYPFIRLVFPAQLNTSAAHWPAVIALLFLASLTCCAYHFFIACFLKKPAQVIRLWPRFNIPMAMLGGFVVPWHAIMKASTILGYLVLLNPLIYITEGLRRAFTGNAQFLPVPVCIAALMAFSFVFIALALRCFKTRTDHI
jgi:ABC-2 type transport system permease protein